MKPQAILLPAGLFFIALSYAKTPGRTAWKKQVVTKDFLTEGLAALRGATGGRDVTLPAEPWVHDLKTTSSFTELWPWLLVLALLLWPLDVALRRVSLGRRELADARAWLGRRLRARRAAAPRTATAEGMLAARERAGGGAARAALLRGIGDATAMTGAATPAPAPTATTAPPPSVPAAPTVAPAAPKAAQAAPTAAPRAPAPGRSQPKAEEVDTLARLREAKRRARGG